MSAGDVTCPIGWDVLVAYWAGDLDDAVTDRLDEHLIGCGKCTAESARVSAVTEAVRAMIPPFITHARLEALRARGLRITSNPIAPNERTLAVFRATDDILLHQLRGLDLTRAESVAIKLMVEETGDVLVHDERVPFDADSGEMLIACQKHFAIFPPNVVVEVRVREATGAETVTKYAIPHLFDELPSA